MLNKYSQSKLSEVKRNHRNDPVFSRKIDAGKRTYFIDVRKTRGDDYYITLTESIRKLNSDRTERHKLFLYREDFNRFLESLEDCINHVKNNLMPNYDYEEFDRRREEGENSPEHYGNNHPPRLSQGDDANESGNAETQTPEDDDMSW